MMKQLRILILLLFFLHSKIGVAFNVHYCGKHIAEISWAFDAKGCGMEQTELPLCDKEKLTQESCCLDDVVIEQNDADQNALKLQKAPSILPNEVWFSEVHQLDHFFHAPEVLQSKDLPPLIALYKRNCSYVFYG